MKWWKKLTGAHIPVHDHFTYPGKEQLTEEDREKLLTLSPMAIELLQRYMIDYHLSDSMTKQDDLIFVGYHIEEAVYGPLFYGYGQPNKPRDRHRYARSTEKQLMEDRPETVLVLLKASPEAIAERMKKNPRKWPPLKERDIENVLERFDEQYKTSLIRRKFELDTTNLTVEETLKQFIELMEPHFRPIDSLRIIQHKILKDNS